MQMSCPQVGCAAEALPLELLATVMRQLLQPLLGRQSSSWRETRTTSQLLRQSLVLCATSRLWREAALLVLPSLLAGRTLQLDETLQPHFLTQLLGQLLHGSHIILAEPLLTAPNVPNFLEVARPAVLSVQWHGLGDREGEPATRDAVGAILASCSSLSELRCQTSPPLHSFPPHLLALEVILRTEELSDQGDDLDSTEAASSLQQQASLQGLLSLETLTIWMRAPYGVRLCEHISFRDLSALRQLVITLDCLGQPYYHTAQARLPVFDLTALGLAEARGIQVQLQVHFRVANYVSTDYCTAREELWRSLARVTPLSQLSFSFNSCLSAHDSAAESAGER